MKKENIIDLAKHRDQQEANHIETKALISKELETAIQHLIYRLRELGPLKSN